MTTFDVEIGKNINQVYMDKIKARAKSVLPVRHFEENEVDKKPIRRSNGNKGRFSTPENER